jgi:hypothetical protein
LGAESIVLTSNKKPVTALVSLKGVDRESLSLSLDPVFLRIIRRARAEVKRGKVYSLEQVKRELLDGTNTPKNALPRTRQERRRLGKRRSRLDGQRN